MNVLIFITMQCRANDENALEVDFGAVSFSASHLTLSSSIGNGLSFVTKFMISKLYGKVECTQPLVDYLLSLNHQGDVRGQQEFNLQISTKAENRFDFIMVLNKAANFVYLQKLMLNETLNTAAKLQMALIIADVYLAALPKNTPYQNFEPR